MKIPYFTESAYLKLYDAVPLNQPNYMNGNTNSWVDEFFLGKEFCKSSRIDATLPTLKKGSNLQTEYENTFLIYSALKDKLSPKQAANPYLWTYLSHCYYWDYVLDRWFSPRENSSNEKIRQRVFCGTETGNRIGLLRNAISRFWWIGFLSYKENSSKPYELTEVLFSNSDLLQSILERKFSMNRNVTLGILSAIKEINDNPNLDNVGIWKKAPEGTAQPAYEWRELCKYINRYGAVTLLDALSANEITKISVDYVLSIR